MDNFEKIDNVSVYLIGMSGTHYEKLRDTLLKVKKYYYIFDNEFFQENSEYIEYILGAVRKVYSEIFLERKEIFLPESDFNNKSLELFRLKFDLEEFLNFLAQKLMRNHDKLNDFENLDSNSELLLLIVNDYVGKLLKESRISDPTSSIRNLKLEKKLNI